MHVSCNISLPLQPYVVLHCKSCCLRKAYGFVHCVKLRSWLPECLRANGEGLGYFNTLLLYLDSATFVLQSTCFHEGPEEFLLFGNNGVQLFCGICAANNRTNKDLKKSNVIVGW